MFKITFLIVVVAVVLGVTFYASCAGKSDTFKTVNVMTFAETIANTDSITLLDVRTPEEFAQGHLPGAMLINVNDADFAEQAAEKLPKEKTVAVYCRSGRRSANAARALTQQGFQVINLNGGIQSWQSANMPVEK